ncbi:mpv17-like protein 2 isoform X2 [Haemorhous mexicanus]|uniref:mpv17-like protein 2 isoform X2 n=1 Tax=Haemorhous mexicanus TaxID=30427 RepID=UPI0028BD26B9|nr:mpv17-like protein 2 isoform X2 [Haemorhous mexicanus]
MLLRSWRSLFTGRLLLLTNTVSCGGLLAAGDCLHQEWHRRKHPQSQLQLGRTGIQGRPGNPSLPSEGGTPPPGCPPGRAQHCCRCRQDVCGGLQPGPPDAFLVPVAGLGVPGAGRALPAHRAEEGADRSAGGIAHHGSLVLHGHRHPGGPISAGELGRAEGEILGIVQG